MFFTILNFHIVVLELVFSGAVKSGSERLQAFSFVGVAHTIQYFIPLIGAKIRLNVSMFLNGQTTKLICDVSNEPGLDKKEKIGSYFVFFENMKVTYMILSIPCLRSLSRSSSLEVERPNMRELKC